MKVFRISVGRWSFSARFGLCRFGRRAEKTFFTGCPAGSFGLGIVSVTYLRRYIIPILYKRSKIGGSIITRAKAMRDLGDPATWAAESAALKAELQRRPGNTPLHLVNGKIICKPK